VSRPNDCFYLNDQQTDTLKMLGKKVERYEREIKECAEATEKMFTFVNATVTGELQTEWHKMQSAPDGNRLKMIVAFKKRVDGGTYLESHKTYREYQLARLNRYMPDATGYTQASISDVEKLEAYLTLEADVRLQIKVHADATKKLKDEQGRPLVAAPPATDHSRIETLKDLIMKNHDTAKAYDIIDDALRKDPVDYEALKTTLFTWVSQNRKSKRPAGADESGASGGGGGGSSGSSGSSSSGGGGGDSSNSGTAQTYSAATVMAAMETGEQRGRQQERERVAAGGPIYGTISSSSSSSSAQRGGGRDNLSAEDLAKIRGTMKCYNWDGQRCSSKNQPCPYLHTKDVDTRHNSSSGKRDRSRSRSPSPTATNRTSGGTPAGGGGAKAPRYGHN